MNWNYRIVRLKKGWLGVCEVFYNDDGTPAGHSADPDGPIGDDFEDLKLTLEAMQRCLNEPILDADTDFVGFKDPA